MNPIFGNWTFVVLCLINALWWGAKGNWPQALYWAGGATINIAVIWGL